MDDVPDLGRIVESTYAKRIFGTEDITPLKTLELGFHLLGLSNGPTLAFKDIALQLLGHLFEKVLQQKNLTLNILGATSGDTGSAAEHALRGKRGIQVFMLSPHGRMSPFQRAQMYALQDPNLHNLAVERRLRRLPGPGQAGQRRPRLQGEAPHRRGDSINWARVAAQVVYYFKGYFAATKENNEEVAFAVPSGNFGNIYAGMCSRHGFTHTKIDSGKQRERRARRVLPHWPLPRAKERAGNLQPVDGHLEGVELRALRLRPRRPRRCARSGPLPPARRQGEFDLPHSNSEFVSGRSTHADRLRTIRQIFDKFGVMIDPHTADGVKVGLEHREPGLPWCASRPRSPSSSRRRCARRSAASRGGPSGFENLEKLPQRFTVMEPDAAAVKRYIEQHGAT